MDIVQPFLRSVRDERIASIDCAIARKVKEDASRLLEEEDSEEMASFCSQLTEVLSGFLPSTSKKSSASYIEEKAWSSFLSSRNSSTSDLWKKLYAHVGLPFTSSLLCQRTNRKVFSYLLNTSIGATDPDATENEKDESLSYDEENTLRYAAGFVPFKLMTKFGGTDDPKIHRFLLCLDNMRCQTDDSSHDDHTYSSFGDYTFRWLELQDRGRLFRVNDSTYRFCVAIEKAVRSFLRPRLKQPKKDLCRSLTTLARELLLMEKFPASGKKSLCLTYKETNLGNCY